MNKHKWYNEIVAWCEGAEIETCSAGIWFSTDYPAWHSGDHQFRIKPQAYRLLWGGGVEPIVKKPHEVADEYAKVAQQAYEDGFVQGKIYAETGRVSDGKPQPKEMKHLYVYIFNGTAMLTETHSGAASGGRYMGKIEVQDD